MADIIDLYFETIGEGKPLIMLHGNGEDLTSLKPLASSLKDQHKIYLIDQRGHGKSPGEVASSYDEMAADLIFFMEKHKITSTDIVGYSDGAIVALKAVIKQPQKFNKLILCGLNIAPDGLTEKTYESIYQTYQKDKDPLCKLMLEGPVFNVSDLHVLNHDIWLYFGEYDVIKTSHQHFIHNQLKHSKLVVLPNENHESYIMFIDKLKTDINALL